MKFPQLPLGQRFLFQGETYVKIGPLTARREQDGEHRLIARSAQVSLPQPGLAATAAEAGTLPDWVLRALDAYEVRLRAALIPADGSADAVLQARLKDGLVAARCAFLDATAGPGRSPKGT